MPTFNLTNGDDTFPGGQPGWINTGEDIVNGLDGLDIIDGGAMNDIVSGGRGDDILSGGDGEDTIFDGLSGPDKGSDTISGGGGDDKLASRGGTDAIDGGAGGDTLTFSRRYATNALTLNMIDLGAVAILEGDGSSVVNVETIDYYGGSGTDTITLLSGNDAIIGARGSDDLKGGAGNDTLVGGSVSGSLLNGFIHASILDYENDRLDGGTGDDTICSTGGADAIDGGSGNDTLVFDRRFFSSSAFHTLDMTAPGTPATVEGDGSTIVNVETINYYGGSSLDTVTLLGGDDIIDGGEGDDVLDGGAGNDTLYDGDNGFSPIPGGDSLNGNAGNDYIESRGGVDIIDGGAGNDWLFFNRFNTSAALTLNVVATGTPATVIGDGSSIVNVEKIYFSGGNGADTVTLFSGDDLIGGHNGDDHLDGGSGNDILYGDDGSDNLSGGFGNDYLSGENGNDFLSGGSGSDKLNGGAGDDFVDGGAGADEMYGHNSSNNRFLDGDDTFVVDYYGDKVFETIAGAAGGIDRVFSTVNFTLSANVERLALQGSVRMNGTGNAQDNSVAGNDGNNFIDGKGETDSLAGGFGKDNFVFSTALGATNIDYIFDFTAVDDTVRLENAVFTVLPVGYLAVAAFNVGAAAADASDRIIYNSATGALLYDADGNGAGVAQQFAAMAAGLTLNNVDFYVF